MRPLVIVFGATASGKSALALALARRFGGEILSCDSVAIYRGMELGTAKPTPAERALIPHHGLDLFDPDQASTAGDYARYGRGVLAQLARRNVLPIVVGGTGLYLRALLDGLSPAPARDAALRSLLTGRAQRRGPGSLERTLCRFDPAAAARIHPNDTPKLIRAIEVSLRARQPMSGVWADGGRKPLEGFRILRIGLNPPRAGLHQRINARAAAMFADGLVEETRALIARFGPDCRPLTSLGYAQAAAVLRGELTEADAIAQAQAGHRQYAKRQSTWFRGEAARHAVHWLAGPGDAAGILAEATALVEGLGASAVFETPTTDPHG